MATIDAASVGSLLVAQAAHSSVSAAGTGDLPLAAIVLVVGLVFLIGFAAGIGVEQASLRGRERQLARGRRDLAAWTRGLRAQQVEYYRTRGGTDTSVLHEQILEDEDRPPADRRDGRDTAMW